MKAIFFGSIGSIVETSEIQRDAFNRAFEAFHLDWHWDQETYRQLLKASGGRNRIADYAKGLGVDVGAAAIHKLKTELFQERLWEEGCQFREGVADVLNLAQARSLFTGLITGTDRQTVDLISTSLKARFAVEFDIVTSRATVCVDKPSPELYRHALGTLELCPSEVIAIEDNQPGIDAALAAGVTTISFPGINTPDVKGATYNAGNGSDLRDCAELLLNKDLGKG